jgi:NADP-dependent 3-hydroxy acid dehydrogenase YdfG
MFQGQVVWMTGASSGIGEALCKQFAAEGAKIVLSARRRPELERVADACRSAGGEALVLPLDVTDHEAMPAALQSVLDRFERVDFLFNNAGIAQRALCVDTDISVYRRIFDVDVLGQIALTKQVLPHMIERKSGHIAVTASVAGKVGAPMGTAYCAAKHAMMGFFDALRAEVSRHDIKVTTVTPGYVRTQVAMNALKGDGSKYGQTDKNIANGMDVDKCARVILAGLRKGKPEIAVGEGREMHALWLKRYFPNQLFRMVEKL